MIIWQTFGPRDAGYHDLYCIYIQLLLLHTSAFISVMLAAFHYAYFDYFDACTSIIEKRALFCCLLSCPVCNGRRLTVELFLSVTCIVFYYQEKLFYIL
jgi:hypothetical protein